MGKTTSHIRNIRTNEDKEEEVTITVDHDTEERRSSKSNGFVSLSPQLASLVRMRTPTDDEVNDTTATTLTDLEKGEEGRVQGRGNITTTHSCRRLNKKFDFQSITSPNGIISSIRSLFGNSDKSSSCPICLDDFCVGDDVCWSKRSEECVHIYHVKCIMDWLMDHDECPTCRQQFVPKV